MMNRTQVINSLRNELATLQAKYNRLNKGLDIVGVDKLAIEQQLDAIRNQRDAVEQQLDHLTD